MAPVFASADIAALVAAFPPPIPTKDQPSLVRSHSSDNLIHSRSVISNFRTLLETSLGRIKKADLPSRLGTDSADWLFDCYNDPVRWSQDRQAIVPKPEFEKIVDELCLKADEDFVNLVAYAAEKDIAVEFLQTDLQHQRRNSNFRLFDNSSRQVYVAREQLANNLTQKLAQLFASGGTEKIALSEKLQDVPVTVLRELALRLNNDDEVQIPGQIEDDGDEIVFVPSGHNDAQEEKRRTAYETKVQSLVYSLTTNGFCDLPSDTDATDVCSQYACEDTKSGATVILSVNAVPKAIVLRPVLDHTQGELKRYAVQAAEKQVGLGHGNLIDADMHDYLVNQTSQPTIASLAMQTGYSDHVEEAMITAIREIAAQRLDRFHDLFRIEVLSPLQLYESGIETVKNDELKTRLNECLGGHFRLEVIPAFVKVANGQGLLVDKSCSRDLNRMLESIVQAKSLSDVQPTMVRFTKKQKIDQSTPTQLQIVKREYLREKCKALQKTTRGSDVLQNLIWILLAQQSEGLFMSPGKDTGRMIKQYQAVGNEEAGKKLEDWRNLLKTGQCDDREIEEMRDLARRTVYEMYGHEDDIEP